MDYKISSFDTPIDGVNPAGIDIEYDTRFLELQRLVEGTPEQEFGDTLIEAKEPDWNGIEKLCCQLLSESKNIQLLCFYIQALTVKYGVIGFSHGCENLAVNLEEYWDSIYPTLYDEDGDYDNYFRMNAISLLSAKEGVARQLNNSMLKLSVNKRISINFKDAITVLSVNNKDDLYPGGQNQLIMDIKVSASKSGEEIKAIEASYGLLHRIQNIYKDKLPQESTPSFDVILSPLKTIIDHIDIASEETPSDQEYLKEEEHDKTNSETTTISHSPYADISMVKITNRKEAEVLLEKACVYFATYEPSHPAPLFIRRALRVLDMNFYEIMQDVSPSSLAEVDNLFGAMFDKEEEKDDDED